MLNNTRKDMMSARNAPKVIRGAITILTIACCAAPLMAHAGLGGNAASIETDRTALNGVVATASQVLAATGVSRSGSGSASSSTSSTTANYTTTTITTDLGTVVNEYMSTGGVIFAVSWSGPAVPNLGQLLGTYFSAVRTGAAANVAAGGTHGPMAMSGTDLVVYSGGVMQAYHGMAYLKSALPTGFDVTQIR